MAKCTDLNPLGKQKTPHTNSLHENKRTNNYLGASPEQQTFSYKGIVL